MTTIRTALLLAILLSSAAAYGDDSNGAPDAAPAASTDTQGASDYNTNTRDASDEDTGKNKKDQCHKAWDEYRQSQACFGPYRLTNGAVKAEAYEHCKVVEQPEYCD